VTTHTDGARLEQVFDAEDGRRVNVYTLSPDGSTLTLEVTVTSPMRASMLGTRDNRERVRVAVTSVAGRTMDVAFVAGAPDAGQDEDPGSEAPPLDDEALLEEFKAMFRAVEEGG
jgi:hypothetical protein